MDNRRMILWLVAAMALTVGWMYFVGRLRQANPQWDINQPPPAASRPATQPNGAVLPATSAATAPGDAASPSSAPQAVYRVAGGPPRTAELGSLDRGSGYPMHVRLSSRGAAISLVTLNPYKQQVDRPDAYCFQAAYDVPHELAASMATRRLIINGQPVDVADAQWRLAGVGSAEASGVPVSATWTIDIEGDAGPVLTVEKTFRVRDRQDATRGFEVQVAYGLRNRGEQPLAVQIVGNGPIPPPHEGLRDVPSVVAGYDDRGAVELEHHAFSQFTVDRPRIELKHKEGLPLLWVGANSAYFNAIVRAPRGTLASATALALRPGYADYTRKDVALAIESGVLEVGVGQTAPWPLEVYLGPRQRSILRQPHYANYPLGYHETLVLTGGICGLCTFQWLINILVAMLVGFHWVFGGFAGHGDWGLAIIALVLVVRLLLHPITKKSQISMSKMGKMGPEIERLKKKYGDDKETLNREMMAIYKQQGFTPILGCLPMFLQMPIWIALWSALQSTFELRHASFLWGLTWIDDLAQPDRLFYFPNHAIPLIFTSLDAINLLPILMGFVFWLQSYWQMKTMPPPATPEAAQQQKMMKWMTLLFPVMLYGGPSGLNLYILTSTAIGIWESKRVRDHIQAQEEAERAGRVLVDAKPTRAGRRLAERKQEPAPPKRGLRAWLADLQKRAEELRNEAEGRNRKR